MNRDDLDKLNREIDEVKGYRLEAKKRAMRSRGWQRWVNLKFAAFLDWAARLGEQIRIEELEAEEPDPDRLPIVGLVLCIMAAAVVFFALGAYFF